MSDIDAQTCYRHPERRAGVVCQRCDKRICPSCMTQASVGFHCPSCVKSGTQTVIRGRNLVTVPYATYVLMGISIVAFLATGGGSGSSQLFRDGFLFGPWVGSGEWYRLVSSGFLHADLLHLGFNMYLLYQLGMMLESRLGKASFVALYAASLAGGSLGVMLVSPNAATVGASGAVFGLMGCAVAAQRKMGIDPFQTGLGGLIVLNLVITFVVPQISIGGHIGGLVFGFATGSLLLELTDRRELPKFIAPVAIGAIALAAFGVAIAIA